MEGEFLLINDNNTRTKFALADRSGLIAHESVFSEEVTLQFVRERLSDWSWKYVLIASVVPQHLEELRGIDPGAQEKEVSFRIPLGIDVDFPDPSTVGADRLANAAAVAGDYPGETVVVVDFGTAVTFDIIDSRPAYVGGVIAPGLEAMRHYLSRRTALLPEIEIVKPDSAIGKTTEHAMQSGAYFGYRGLVREILRRVEEEMGVPVKTVATGGYAALMADGLPEIDEVDSTLTMKGMLRIATLNFPK